VGEKGDRVIEILLEIVEHFRLFDCWFRVTKVNEVFAVVLVLLDQLAWTHYLVHVNYYSISIIHVILVVKNL